MFERLLVVAALALIFWATVARSSSGAGRERVHVVRPGDTLWAIATASYSGDPREGVWKLRQRNGSTADVLMPGERLYIPR